MPTGRRLRSSRPATSEFLDPLDLLDTFDGAASPLRSLALEVFSCACGREPDPIYALILRSLLLWHCALTESKEKVRRRMYAELEDAKAGRALYPPIGWTRGDIVFRFMSKTKGFGLVARSGIPVRAQRRLTLYQGVLCTSMGQVDSNGSHALRIPADDHVIDAAPIARVFKMFPEDLRDALIPYFGVAGFANASVNHRDNTILFQQCSLFCAVEEHPTLFNTFPSTMELRHQNTVIAELRPVDIEGGAELLVPYQIRC